MFDYLRGLIKENILKWDVLDIYVISLFVYDEDDDPNFPTVVLGYNTVSNYIENIEFEEYYITSRKSSFNDNEITDILFTLKGIDED